MIHSKHSSRDLYSTYREQIRHRTLEEEEKPVHHDGVRLGREKSRRRNRSFTGLFVQFWQLIRGHQRMLLFALATLSLGTLISLIPPYGSKLVMDNVLGDEPLSPQLTRWVPLPTGREELLWTVAISMVVIAIVSVIVMNWSRWQATRISKRVTVSTRKRVFEHAVRLPLHRVYELKSGGVASILREDAGASGELVFSMLYNPWRAVVQLAGTLLILAATDWRLLVGGLSLLPIVWFTHRTWIARIRPIWRDIRTTRQGIDAHATESFGGMRVVRSFGRQRTEATSFTTSNHLMARQEIFAWWWMRGIDIAWGLLIPIASAVLLWYGATRILQDRATNAPNPLTVGDLVMFLFYLTSLLGPIAALAQSATGLQNNLAGLDRVLDLLREPIEMAPTDQSVMLRKEQVRGQISIQNLSFAYQGAEQPVLQDINLEVAAGEMIAFVGPSGAGKTTLCNLIARFYDPTEGAILLDGVDLRQINVDSYRRLLGIVEQDTFLFDGTIAQNIAYGRRSASLDEIIAAAKKANAHSFITSLEHGYDTLIGERGVKLSGGQRQRLTIARAILADPKILILDEATSNLDTESERLIQSSLATLMKGRTSFVIAHRLSTIAGADRIVVIDKKQIQEVGTHEELMARSTRYRAMVELQTRPAAERVVEEEEEPAM